MRIIKQSWTFESEVNGEAFLRQIEKAGRTCYKSEVGSDRPPSIESVRLFCKGLINSGHHSVLEHPSVSVRIITDRGVTHEIVRHRLVSYSQESTRYCNYSKGKFGKELTIILPVCLYDATYSTSVEYATWVESMERAEGSYLGLISLGWTPQYARAVLPNSLKTELVMTCNLREWRHFFTLRCSPKAHPQMRELAVSMLVGFREAIPVLFDDINFG